MQNLKHLLLKHVFFASNLRKNRNLPLKKAFYLFCFEYKSLSKIRFTPCCVVFSSLAKKSVQNVQLDFKNNCYSKLCWKLVYYFVTKYNFLLKRTFYFILCWKFSFCLILRPSCQKMRFRQICAKNSSFCSTMRIAILTWNLAFAKF